MPQGRDGQLRQSGGGDVAELTRGEQERHPLCQQAASHEGQRAGRAAIEPLRVIDHGEEWLLLGGLREQAEHREPHEERARRRARAEPERDGERVALGVREPIHERGKRCAQVL